MRILTAYLQGTRHMFYYAAEYIHTSKHKAMVWCMSVLRFSNVNTVSNDNVSAPT